MSISPRARLLRLFRLLALLAAASLLSSACAAPGTPPRSPLDDRGAVPTAPAGVQNFPPPFSPPAGSASPGAAATSTLPASPAAGDREAAIGTAIEVLANRMAVPATRLSLLGAERVDWPNACLGVALPGTACAQVVTPGYRVRLRFDTGSTHEVRTGGGGLAAWVAQVTLKATVQQAERADAALAIAVEGRPAAVLLAPGTQRLEIAAGTLRAGDRVILGVDDLRDGSPLRAVWIAKDTG